MSDRLPELQRQRALIRDHLAWLDREIAALQPAAPSGSPPAEGPGAGSRPAPATDTQAAEILSHYRQEPVSLQDGVRRGCLLYFFGALGLLVVSVGVAYLLYIRNR